MFVSIDNREKGERREKAYSFFKDKGVGSEVVQLPVGDFLFDKKVVFEYKTADDFISSVKDKRIFKQVKRMEQFPFSFVLIQGNVFKTIKDLYKWNPYGKVPFNTKQYIGALATILERDCKVIQVETQGQAFDAMYRISRVCLENNKDKKAVDKPVTKLTDPVATFLSCIDDIGVTKAVLIKNQLGLDSLEDLVNITYDDLIKVKGIGKATANKIIGVL